MKKGILLILLIITISEFLGQSIINTEKMFNDSKDGLGISSKLSGNSIQGNASVLFLNFSLNFSYQKEKHYLRLLSGGSNITKDNELAVIRILRGASDEGDAGSSSLPGWSILI